MLRRSLTPAPGCWALAGGERLKLLELDPRSGHAGLVPGAVLTRNGELLVGCGDGACAIRRLQPAGKRVLTVTEYLNGHRPPERLG